MGEHPETTLYVCLSAIATHSVLLTARDGQVRDFALEVIQAPYFIAGNSIGERHTQMHFECDFTK